MRNVATNLLSISVLTTGLVILNDISSAVALPLLQLDILNGYYGGANSIAHLNETVLIEENIFTVYAYCKQGKRCQLPYYLAASIVPQANAPGSVGSFTVNGVAYGQGTANPFVYGTPPLEIFGASQLGEVQDLPNDGTFDTLFAEIPFTFDLTQTRQKLDVQTTPGTNPLDHPGNKNKVVYAAFNFDLTRLANGYDLHFNLYSTKVKNCKKRNPECISGATSDVDIKNFAPLTHDAGTTNRPLILPPAASPASTPEPTSLAGLFALLGSLAVLRRK